MTNIQWDGWIDFQGNYFRVNANATPVQEDGGHNHVRIDRLDITNGIGTGTYLNALGLMQLEKLVSDKIMKEFLET